MPDRPCEINAWNEKYRFVGGIGVNSPGADVFLFSHLFYAGVVDAAAVLAGAAAACRPQQKSLHRTDVGHCRLSIRQRYTLGEQSGIGRALEPGADRPDLVLLADVSGGGATQSAVRHEYRAV